MNVTEWAYDDLGVEIWEKKYRHNNETFDEWLDRVSGGDRELRHLIETKKFLFGGRILANRGLTFKTKLEKKKKKKKKKKLKKHKKIFHRKITYSNCYVVAPPEDNIESIFKTASEIARTFSYGGGVGVDISKLAPRGAVIHNAAQTTTGAVSFMDLFSLTSELIGQEGRRGALMISIDSEHPDLEEFITIKEDLNKITKANISVRTHDSFMECVKKDYTYKLHFYRPESEEFIYKEVKAKDIFMKIAEMNWKMGEPGVLFWDQIESWNLISGYSNFEYAGVNPCAEEPLPAGGSCLLGSINLSEFVRNGVFDFEDFKKTVKLSVKALNNVLDEGMKLHPLQEQREAVKKWRQIGLGIMGLADMLIKMGYRYGSDESLELCDKIGEIMAKTAISESNNLAKQDTSFPMFDQEATERSGFYKLHRLQDLSGGLRNSQLLTCAPTGSISTMIGVSGGIEPIFDYSYDRKTESLSGQEEHHKVYTKIAKEYMDATGTKEDELPDYYITAAQIDYRKRVDMQAVWQKHIDASISSTINLPEWITPETIFDIYLYAWKKRLKGLTIYRENCDRTGILTKESTEKTVERGKVIQVGDNVVGKKRKLMTGCGSLHCLTFFDKNTGDLLETYLNKGSTGGCNNFMIGLSRMMSLAARAGATVDDIIDQLESTGVCPSYAVRTSKQRDTSPGSCCPMAVAKALREMSDEMKEEISTNGDEEPIVSDQDGVCLEVSSGDKKDKCPECGSELVHSGGCMECRNCGYSKCN